MKRNTSVKNINVDKTNYIYLEGMKQEDDVVLTLSLFKDGLELDCTGQTGILGVKRPDNTYVEQKTGISINKNIVTINMKKSIFNASGIIECDLELSDNAGKFTTSSFMLKCDKKILSYENIINSNEISGIESVTLELKNKLNELNQYAKEVEEEISEKNSSIQTVINDITINSNKLLSEIRENHKDLKDDSSKLLSDIRQDYENLKGSILDEDLGANLQEQINEINEELSNKPSENDVKGYIQEAIDEIDLECSTDGLQEQINEINSQLSIKPSEDDVKGYIQEAIDGIDFDCSCEGGSSNGSNIDISGIMEDIDNLNSSMLKVENEVIEARTDSKGVAYSSLKDRLNSLDAKISNNQGEGNTGNQGGGNSNTLSTDLIINLKDLGLAEGASNAQLNANILKNLIETYPKGQKTFYFPKGAYHFNPIDLTNISGDIIIKLKGENDGINPSWFNYQSTSIITNGQDFLYDKRNTSPGYKVFVDGMRFYSRMDYSQAPSGVCFGAQYNSGGEYNFHFYNVLVFGFDYGFKSPGYSCTGSGGKHFCVSNCHYGIYIAGASHLFNADGVELTNNVVGIRFGHGGNPCTLSNVHIASGYLAPDKNNFDKYISIHCKGDVHINGIYQEDYNGADASKQIIIDYEGHASGVGPVIVENTPIILPSASGGLFFRGATYFGNGPEAGVTSPTTIYSGNLSHYPDGCVKFVNCPVRSRTDVTDIFEVPAQSPGYDINGKTFIANNSIISKNPYGRINSKWTSVLTRNSVYNTNFFYELYSYEDLGTAYKGILPKNLSVLRTIDEKANIRLKGNLIIEDTLSSNIDVVFGFAHKYKDSNGAYVYDFHPITRLQGGQGMASFPFDITLDRYSTEDAFTNIIPATKVLENGVTNSTNSTKRLVYGDYLKIRLNFEIEQQRNM